MPRIKKTEEVIAETSPVKEELIVEDVVAKVDSPAKIVYLNTIEAYKKNNPKKYEAKKDFFERRLNTL